MTVRYLYHFMQQASQFFNIQQRTTMWTRNPIQMASIQTKKMSKLPDSYYECQWLEEVRLTANNDDNNYVVWSVNDAA
jgi:hypothetical protein